MIGGAEQGHDDAGLRADADGGDEHLAAALHDVRAGEEHGPVDVLLDEVRLAGETRLVDLEIVGLEDEAVGGYGVAVEDLANVADEDLLDGQQVDLAVAQHADLLVRVDLGLEAAELTLLAPVVERRDHDDDDDGDEDGDALDPLDVRLLHLYVLLVGLLRVVEERESERDDRADVEYDERGVLQRLPHQVEERLGRLGRYLVLAELGGAVGQVLLVGRRQAARHVRAQLGAQALDVAVLVEIGLLLVVLEAHLHEVGEILEIQVELALVRHFCKLYVCLCVCVVKTNCVFVVVVVVSERNDKTTRTRSEIRWAACVYTRSVWMLVE